MKVHFLFLAALLFAIACTRPIPPQKTGKPPSVAENIRVCPGYIEAEFESGQNVVLYFNGDGASFVTPGCPQMEIAGQAFADLDGSFICSDRISGDYVHLYTRSGFARVKYGGVVYDLFPKNKPVQ